MHSHKWNTHTHTHTHKGSIRQFAMDTRERRAETRRRTAKEEVNETNIFYVKRNGEKLSEGNIFGFHFDDHT